MGKKPGKGKKRPRASPSWLIRADELAKLLGVGSRTLTRMIQERKIGPKRIIPHRRSIGWDRSEIEVWLRIRGPDGQWYDEESWARIRDAVMAQHFGTHTSNPNNPGIPGHLSRQSIPSASVEPGDADHVSKRGKLR